jgi:hypothetical protein
MEIAYRMEMASNRDSLPNARELAKWEMAYRVEY